MPDKASLERLLETETRIASELPGDPQEIRVPALTILCHPDVGRIGEIAPLAELTAGRPAALSRTEPAFAQPGDSRLVPLADPYLSRRPISIELDAERRCLRLDRRGTSTRAAVDGRALGGEEELPTESLKRGVVLLLADRIVLLLHLQDPVPAPASPDFGLVGHGPAMSELRREIRQVMDLDVPVLIRGETGTGKELAAQAIHRFGGRREGPFVPVNMGALPPTLAAAELFGAARGAYTGAHRSRRGFFLQARGGTLFLDEIGLTPPEVQVMLLRAIEEGEIQPLGSETREAVDVRLITATDADLEDEARRERFRSPLLHRLSGFQIWIPPLRQRREDLGRLLLHFFRQALAETGERERLEPASATGAAWLPASLVARLAELPWPGNVRQLGNVARQLIITNRGRSVLRIGPAVERLLDPDRSPGPAGDRRPGGGGARRRRRSYRDPAEIGEEELVAALEDNRWRMQDAARQLGVSRTSLYKLVDRSPAVQKAADLGRGEIEAARERCGGDLDKMVDELRVSERGLKRRMRKLGLT